jgi:hypothetical protein
LHVTVRSRLGRILVAMFRRHRHTLLQLFVLSVALTALARSAAAQDRPFLFSVSTPERDDRRAALHYEASFGERPFDLVDGDRPEQRFGVQAAFGNGFIVLGRIGVAADGRDTRSSQQGEVLYSPWRGLGVAAGLGMRHESAGVNVLLGRVIAGRRIAAWRLDGNLLFEKPLSTGRDAVDLITTFGVARSLTPMLHAGLEMIGEDLEGFWDPNEAEGGARILIGPSLRVAPPSQHWQVSVTGGPIFHATSNDLNSSAARSLPGSRNGYAVRAAVSYGFSNR